MTGTIHTLDLSGELASVGERGYAFPVPRGRGANCDHGASILESRDLPPRGLKARDNYIPDLHRDTIKVKTGDCLPRPTSSEKLWRRKQTYDFAHGWTQISVIVNRCVERS